LLVMKAKALRIVLAGPVLLTALFTANCGGSPEDPKPTATTTSSTGAPIILISIDTLRPDRLGAYGSTRATTPAIDALARDGILFENAYSHCPLTLPAHSSMLTGVLPTEHGVRDNIGYHLASEKLPFLPRLLQERGYQTGAAVSAYILRRDTGIGDNFDFYEDSLNLRSSASLGENQRPGGETVRYAVEWLETVRESPFFLFLHLYDPHTPYEPPEPYASRHAGSLYDGEVAATDAIVADFMAELRRLGIYDRATILLVSDHGEGLGEHGEAEHGILLYREALQVPLLLKLPSSAHAGTKVAAPAQLIDIYPTLATLAGEKVEATTLLDLLKGGAPPRQIYSETYYPRLHLGWSELTSIVSDDLHLIDGPDPELYNLATDTAETTNVLRQRRREYVELRDALAGMRRELEAPAAVDDETRKRLEALGYLATHAAATEGPLPDPKGEIHLLAEVVEATRLQNERRYPEAVARFEKIVAANPNMADAWENLGLSLHHLGRFEPALAAYEKALELSQGADHVALGAARVLLEMGRFEDAKVHAELALATNPAAAHLLLARLAFAGDDLEAASAAARASLAARANAVAPYLLLAQIEIKRQNSDAALVHIAEAEKVQARRQDDEPAAGLFFVKGDIFARLGRNAEAAEAFLREIRTSPDDPRSYCRLSVIYALEERPQEAVGILQHMVTASPTPASYAAAVETLRALGEATGAGALLRHAQGLFPGNAQLLRVAEEANATR
jgi:choline-sulfatase